MNFREDQLSTNFNLPSLLISNRSSLPAKTFADSVNFSLHLSDDLAPLDRINIWVNNVAIKGMNGIDLRDENSKQIDTEIAVFLADGANKIELSVLNQSGIESYKEVIEIVKEGKVNIPTLYLTAIGTSIYKDDRYNLNYADKDAKDLAFTFKQAKCFKEVKTLELANEAVILENLHQIKTFFEQATINDIVVLFIAGHGVLDVDFNYFFATHDIDFNNPGKRGVPYEEIEKLLDGLKVLKKILLMDTCHSGELDKDELIIDENSNSQEDGENGEIIFRRAGVSVALKEDPLNLQSTNDLMKFLFTDLRKGTGATVVSSSGGAELSIETNGLKNGLFTAVLMKGLMSGAADLNQDGQILVSEIQLYTQLKVRELSKGLQTPTSRIQNIELDYRIW